MSWGSFEFGGLVTTSWGQRSAVSDVAEGQNMARTVANDVIDTVDDILDTLKLEGGASLNAALTAISGLEGFRPQTIEINYTPPDFIRSTFIVPDPLDLGEGGGEVVAPAPLNFVGQVTDLAAPPITGTQPVISDIAIDSPPSLQLIGSPPVAPSLPTLSVPEAPDFNTLPALELPVLTPPSIRELQLPEFIIPTLPEFTLDLSSELPEVPQIGVVANIEPYESTFTINENPVLLVEGDTLIGDRLMSRELRASVEVLRSRGITVDSELEQAQIDFATERAGLLNATEVRKFTMDEILRDTELARALLVFLVQADVQVSEAGLAFAKALFEAEIIRADAQIQLVNAAVSLYNARVSALNVEVDIYRTRLEAQLAGLERWKALIEAEIAKTRLNAAVRTSYVQQVQALTAQADLYQAEVQALMVNVDQYKARMQAVAAEAEVARTNLLTYSGEVESYAAGLTGYKARFEAYAAGVRSVAAQNQVEQARTQISVAQLQAAGAGITNVVSAMELQAERLKLQAINQSAQYEDKRLRNQIESINAQIDADIGKRDMLEWAANSRLTDATNDAIADNARSAARYYENASNSTYRAAEQAFRAVSSATGAAAVAQEAAGRAAASVAQGAYSAVHVSASLSGSGSVSAREERNDRASMSFTDMWNYNEQRTQSIDA